MATPFVLPDDAKGTFRALAADSDEEYGRLITFIKKLPTTQVFSVTLDRLMSKVPREERGAIYKLLNELSRLSRTGSNLNLPTEALVTLASEQVIETDSETRARLAFRLGELLSQKAIVVHLRAFDLLYEEERCLLKSRIITDVRPVFDDAASAAQGFIIVNHLHVTFLQDGERRNMFFALDESDVGNLASLAQRAKTKIKFLKTIIPTVTDTEDLQNGG